MVSPAASFAGAAVSAGATAAAATGSGATGAGGIAAGAAGIATAGVCCIMVTGAAASPFSVLMVILISPISRFTSLAPDLATNLIRFCISFNSMVIVFKSCKPTSNS